MVHSMKLISKKDMKRNLNNNKNLPKLQNAKVLDPKRKVCKTGTGTKHGAKTPDQNKSGAITYRDKGTPAARLHQQNNMAAAQKGL